MYNLIISANDDAWKSGSYEIDSSRYLEYTVSTISEKLKSFSSNIDFLMSLPCLFAYEGTEKPYRVGWLTNVKERDKMIYIEYKLDDSVEPIPFEKIMKIAQPLDIRKWEINRTHWAVKDGDLFEILSRIDVKFENPVITKLRTIKKEIVKNETVSTVTGFIQKIFSFKSDEDCEVFYRGHSNKKSYKLEPSLFRKDNSGNFLYLQNEDILYRELLVSNSSDFQGDTYTLDKLVRMQHYSLPTRMLDITSNPLISLYFAAISDDQEDGEVIIFNINKNFIKYFDSDTASCIANLSRLPYLEKDEIDYSEENFNEQDSIKKLLHLIREEKPYFSSSINPDDLKKIICVKSKMTNTRIVSQSGSFLLFGHDSLMNEDGMDGIRIDRIVVKNKIKILEELDRLNINERTVFPYIENSAKYVRKKYKVKY